MANQIRLKRGSGSNPSASDLAVGELAVRTDTGILFTKDDGGSVITLGGGGALSDGDYGDITVSNSGSTFTIDSGVVTESKIGNNSITLAKMANNSVDTDELVSGAVTNAKVDSNAAISLSKLEVITSNRIVGNDSGNAVPKELTAAEVRTIINVEDGATADQTASEILTLIKTVDGSGSGLDADTVDGIQGGSFLRGDVDDTTVGHLTFNRSSDAKFSLQGSSNPFFNLKEGTTEKARFQWSSSGYVWIQNHEDNSVIVLRDNLGFSPDAGNTIHSIFHAGNLTVGDGGLTQKNFTTTLKNKLDGIAASATNNGSGNAITDGDKGDITVSSSGGTFTIDNDVVTTAKMINFPTGTLLGRSSSGTGNATTLTASEVRSLLNVENGATADQSASEILTLLKTVDGAGSGLDADTLDGISSASFLRSDTDDTFSAVLTLSSTSRDCINLSGGASDDNRGIAFNGRIALSADQNDGYLRLNNASEFSNGVYTPGVIRADNGFQVDGTTIINGNGNIAYSRLTGTPTIPTNNNQLTNGAGYITSASFSDVAGGGTFTGDISLSGGAGAMTVNANSDIRFTNGTWSGNTTKIQHHSNYLYIVGGSNGIIFREGGNDRAIIDPSGHLIPGANNTYRLGSPTVRWQDVYTNDLNLSNEGGSNKVDNTWGDYTIQEGADDLFIINNRNGKMFKFMLQEVK